MVRIFNVYEPEAMDPSFVVLVDHEDRRTRFYDLSLGQVEDVLRAAQVFPVIAMSLDMPQYERLYQDSNI